MPPPPAAATDAARAVNDLAADLPRDWVYGPTSAARASSDLAPSIPRHRTSPVSIALGHEPRVTSL